MPQRLEEQEREITAELPADSSGQHASRALSSSSPSWLQLISTGVSGVISIYVAAKILAWLPECLRMVILPSGGVSHDPWAWAPLVLDLAAAIAVAAPTSFRSFLDFCRGFFRGGRTPNQE